MEQNIIFKNITIEEEKYTYFYLNNKLFFHFNKFKKNCNEYDINCLFN